MADFEDSLSPTWENVAHGQQNLYDAVRKTISFENPANGKKYALNDDPAILMCRVRGIHLQEKGCWSMTKCHMVVWLILVITSSTTLKNL